MLRGPALVFSLALDKSRQALRWALSPLCVRSQVQTYADHARAHEVVAGLVLPLAVRGQLYNL